MPARKSFSELSPRGRFLASLVTVLSLVLVATAERDLQHRPAAELRGNKPLWRLLCLNAVGAHLAWGRRRAPEAG